jgi:hypothetical protein
MPRAKIKPLTPGEAYISSVDPKVRALVTQVVTTHAYTQNLPQDRRSKLIDDLDSALHWKKLNGAIRSVEEDDAVKETALDVRRILKPNSNPTAWTLRLLCDQLRTACNAAGLNTAVWEKNSGRSGMVDFAHQLFSATGSLGANETLHNQFEQSLGEFEHTTASVGASGKLTLPEPMAAPPPAPLGGGKKASVKGGVVGEKPPIKKKR